MALVYGYDRVALVFNEHNFIVRVPNNREDCGITLNTKLCT